MTLRTDAVSAFQASQSGREGAARDNWTPSAVPALWSAA